MAGTRDNILELGSRLIREKGYSGFSYQDIADVLEIKKASIHYHFKSKEELGIGIMSEIGRRLDMVEEFLKQYDCALKRLDMFMEEYYAIREDSMICPISAFQVGWNNVPDKLKEKVRETTQKELQLVENIIAYGQERGEVTIKHTAREFALQILTAYKGSLQYMRVMEETVGEWKESLTRKMIEEC